MKHRHELKKTHIQSLFTQHSKCTFNSKIIIGYCTIRQCLPYHMCNVQASEDLVVVYFDQQRHACACTHMVENLTACEFELHMTILF